MRHRQTDPQTYTHIHHAPIYNVSNDHHSLTITSYETVLYSTSSTTTAATATAMHHGITRTPTLGVVAGFFSAVAGKISTAHYGNDDSYVGRYG